VQMGDTITIDAGKNINITQNGQNISIATSMSPTFDNVTTKNLTVSNGGVINMGGNNITNVASPTAGTDAANKDYVDNVKLNYKGDTGTGSNKLSDTVTFAGTTNQIVTSAEDGKVTFKLDDKVNESLTKANTSLQSFTVGADNTGTNVTVNQSQAHFNITGTENFVNTTVNGQNITVDIAQSFKDTVSNNTVNIANNTANITKNADEIAKGFGLKAQDGNNVTKKLGEQVEVVGGNSNLNTTVSDNQIKINLNNTLDLTSGGSVTIGSTLLNTTGLTITGGPSVTTSGINAGDKKITNVTAGTNPTDAVNFSQLDAVNKTASAGWNLNTSGNATVANVAPNSTVTFNGDGNINVTHTGSTVNVTLNNTVDLGKDGSLTVNGTTINNNGTISGVANGTLSATSTEAVNGSQLFATNQNVTNNTNNIANNTASINKGTVYGGDTGKEFTRKLGEQTNVKGGITDATKLSDNNIGVVSDGTDTLMVKLAKDLTNLTSATFSDSDTDKTVINKDGVTITNGTNTVSLTETGLNNGGNQITNVSAGVADTDAVNMSQLNAVNATASAGWNLTDGTNASTVKPNATVSLTNTDGNINIINNNGSVTFDLANELDLGTNGSVTIGNTSVNNDGLTVGNTSVSDNGLTIVGGPSVTQAGIDAGGKKVTGVLAGDISANSTEAINGSQIYQIEQNVTAAKTEVGAGKNINVSSTTGANGQTVYTVATTPEVDFDKLTVGNVTISKDNGISAGNSKITQVAAGELSESSKDAVNGSQLYQTNQNITNLSNEVAKGWDVTTGVVEGSTGNVTGSTTANVAMGDTVSVKAGNNIAITQEGKNISIATSLTPTFETVTTETVTVGKGSNTATIGTIEDSHGKAINIAGSDGSSPTRITNVAAGQADTDAVNVSQVRNVANHINSNINKVDKNLRAGIAGAMASSNLYHATIPGKSMVAAGAGVYKGESALAIGYSRLSDNGKIGVKFSVNSNTRGDTGAAASVGYQW
ncbi:YadA-like family protein, partial [Lonepinella sp. BR2919]|uniref:YadA-like family protein n=1 Tax=unclassified Lonepinella TaxID=2642006 RepID=UPI003F6DBAF9